MTKLDAIWVLCIIGAISLLLGCIEGKLSLTMIGVIILVAAKALSKIKGD